MSIYILKFISNVFCFNFSCLPFFCIIKCAVKIPSIKQNITTQCYLNLPQLIFSLKDCLNKFITYNPQRTLFTILLDCIILL